MTVAFLLSFFLALQALLLSFFIASRRFFVACLVASHFSLHCVVIFTAYLVAIILIRTKSQPLNKAEIKVLSIYVYNHLSNVSFVPYFLFPNALMRIIIWLCYQPLLGRHFAGSTVFCLFLHCI